LKQHSRYFSWLERNWSPEKTTNGGTGINEIGATERSKNNNIDAEWTVAHLMLNARRALVGVGLAATGEAPWSPPGKLASNVGSRRS
jgi:hypothetical protein